MNSKGPPADQDLRLLTLGGRATGRDSAADKRPRPELRGRKIDGNLSGTYFCINKGFLFERARAAPVSLRHETFEKCSASGPANRIFRIN